MNHDMLNNNKVYLQGQVASTVKFNHSVIDEDFYSFNLDVPRLSGEVDRLPIVISPKLLAGKTLNVGDDFAMRGQFRSFNKVVDGRSKLILSVFCREVCEWDELANPNSISLTGFICKPSIYRVTPFNREISDILLAVNRNYDKSDYIPCIAWGRNAQFVSKLPVGTKLDLEGRIQSRKYNKHLEGEENITEMIAYEVSVSKLASVLDENAL